jgi:hypothetical protein
VASATGWTQDYILDHLTWADINELSAYWKHHPPVQAMVQAYLGIKVPEEPESEVPISGPNIVEMDSAEFAEFLKNAKPH